MPLPGMPYKAYWTLKSGCKAEESKLRTAERPDLFMKHALPNWTYIGYVVFSCVIPEGREDIQPSDFCCGNDASDQSCQAANKNRVEKSL